MEDLWPALGRSLGIASLATVVAALVAVPLAWLLARRRFAGKSLLETVLTVPLVLPPTVVGYVLLLLLGRHGWLTQLTHVSFTFRWQGAVVAAAVVAMPLLFLPAKAAFASIDRELEDVSRLMGAGTLTIFWHVSLPLARKGIASGLLLAFARALGEFGATVMVLGDMDSSRTLPIYIFDQSATGFDAVTTRVAVSALVVVSLLIVFLYNRLPLSRQD